MDLFQIKCKNGIDGTIFESVTDVSGKTKLSDPATNSIIPEEKVINDHDLTGASHVVIPVHGEPQTGKNWNEGLPKNSSEKSYPEMADVVLSTTAQDVSGRLGPVDTTEEAFIKSKEDEEKIEGEKADNGITSLFDDEADRIAVPEALVTSVHGGEITQNGDSTEQNGLKRFDEILAATGESTQLKNLSAELRSGDTTEDELNKKDEGDEKRKELEAKHEIILFLEEETCRTSTQDANEVANGLSESVERITQGKEKQKDVKIDMSQTEQHGSAKEVVDFSAKDLLCFAWQVARGMVSAEINPSGLVNIYYN